LFTKQSTAEITTCTSLIGNIKVITGTLKSSRFISLQNKTNTNYWQLM